MSVWATPHLKVGWCLFGSLTSIAWSKQFAFPQALMQVLKDTTSGNNVELDSVMACKRIRACIVDVLFARAKISRDCVCSYFHKQLFSTLEFCRACRSVTRLFRLSRISTEGHSASFFGIKFLAIQACSDVCCRKNLIRTASKSYFSCIRWLTIRPAAHHVSSWQMTSLVKQICLKRLFRMWCRSL